jgi:hypothetical protein
MGESFFIYCQQGSQQQPLVLGVLKTAQGIVVVQQVLDPSQNQTWSLIAVPGTPLYFLQHLGTGLYLAMSSNQGGQAVMQDYNPLNTNQMVRLDYIAYGFVAINDPTGTYVLNVEGASKSNDAPVISWPWDQGANAQWLFAVPPQ